MERRSFLKASAALGCAATVTGCKTDSDDVNVVPPKPPVVDEVVNWSACTCNCSYSCALKIYSQDGVLTRVESDSEGDDRFGNHQSRACLRGRAYKRKVYAPDRLKVPMKRVGKRGEGKFVEITWDEAYSTIAKELKRIIDTYGNESIYCQYGTGRLYSMYSGGHWTKAGQWGGKLLNILGGHLEQYNTYSSGQQANASKYTFGGGSTSNYAELANSDFFLNFGHNPAETEMSGTGGNYSLQEFTNHLESVFVDPRLSDTVVSNEKQWLPIRPGTDAILCEALSYEIITRGAADQAFLDKYCIGYDEKTLPESAPKNSDYKSHILGLGEDKIAKTPAYAAPICGIPEHKIKELADKLIAAERPFISQGLGVQRHAAGEVTVRAIIMLPCLLGKMGVSGTNTGLSIGKGINGFYSFSPTGSNPVKARIPCFKWSDAIVRGEEMTALKDGITGAEKLSTNLKFIWNYAGNTLINQHSDSNGTAKILEDESLCEFILVHDVQMTPSAKFADILLPDLMDVEVNDISANPGINISTVIAMTTNIEPQFSAKGNFEVCLEIAKRLGVEGEYAEGKTYNEWLTTLYNEQAVSRNLPNYDDLVKLGLYRVQNSSASIGLKSFIENPESNPLRTPSGKIEIYSETLAEMAATWELPDGDEIPAIPKYVKTWEGFEDEELKKQFPLQLIGHHTKGRTHSSFHSNDWLREAVQDSVWINNSDAQELGIKHGDEVIVESLRGKVRVQAKVTSRIIKGAASLPQGAWYKPENGVDVGGNVNTLTSARPTAIGKCNPQHTNLVKITRV